MKPSRWQCADCGSFAVQVAYAVWYREHPDYSLTEVDTDKCGPRLRRVPRGLCGPLYFYCEDCDSSDYPLDTADQDRPHFFDWFSGCGRLALTLPAACREECAAPGRAADPHVARWLADEHVGARVRALDSDDVRDYLRGFGAWEESELANDDENRARILWIACGDVLENPDDYTKEQS